MKYLGNLAILLALGLFTTGCQEAADTVQDAAGDATTAGGETAAAPGGAVGGAAAAVGGVGDAVGDAGDAVGDAGDAVRDAGDRVEYTERAIRDAGKGAVHAASWQQTRGKVTFQGKPVDQAEVVFYRKSSPFNRIAQTDGQGQFECRTHLGKGLPVGEYQVVVRPIFVDPAVSGNWDPNDPIPPMNRQDIPQKYQGRNTSKLWLKVVEGDNEMNIVLEN